MPTKVLIISACSGTKAFDPVVDCEEIDSSSRRELVDAHPEKTLPARSLYTGDEHSHVEAAVDQFDEIADVDWRIVSAGFGLVQPDTVLPAYECTFRNPDSVRQRVSRMGYDPDTLTQREQIRRASNELGIPDDIWEALNSGIDVAFIVLGEDYLTAAESSLSAVPGETTAFAFAAKGSRDLIGDCEWVPSTETERDALGTTWTRVKGVQLRNVVRNVANQSQLRSLHEPSTVREMSLAGNAHK